METLSFYSYKGGVGRSLLLSNIAAYLSKFGFRVCIIDFDLEAPGLHYKMGIKPEKIEKGLLDYISEYIRNGVIEESIIPYTQEIFTKNVEKIVLIPAGNTKSSAYWENLSKINWNNFLYSDESQGIAFFLEMKDRIQNEIKPDFLLIDSRTGVTEIGGVCTSLLPDKVIFVLTNNDENFDGSCQILQNVVDIPRFGNLPPIQTYFALTRIPESEDNSKESLIIDKLSKKLSKIITNKDVSNNIFTIHSDRNLEFSEFLAIDNSEQSDKSPLLLNDYLKLFSHIINPEIIEPKMDSVIDNVLDNQNLLEDFEEVQIQLENLVKNYPKHRKTLEKLLFFYLLRNESTDKFLAVFNDLIQLTAKNINERLISKYFQLFIETEEYQFKFTKKNNFDLAFIRKKISELSYDNFKVTLVLKLSNVYIITNKATEAIELIKELENDVVSKNIDILSTLMNAYFSASLYSSAKEIFIANEGLLTKNVKNRLLYLRAIDKMKEIESVDALLTNDNELVEILIDESPEFAYNLLIKIGKESLITNKLEYNLKNAINTRNERQILKLGELYYLTGKEKDFQDKLKNYPGFEDIIGEFNRMRKRRFY